MKNKIIITIVSMLLFTALAGCGKTEAIMQNDIVDSVEQEETNSADLATSQETQVQETDTVLEAESQETETQVETESARSTLSQATQHQISALIGVLDNYDTDIFTADAEGCMWILHKYMNDCGEYSYAGNTDDLPYGWRTRIVSKEEFNAFFGTGWGIEIPADFTYTAGETDYGMKITDNGWESNLDGSLYTAQGGTVEITGLTDGVYTLSGTFLNGAGDDEALTQKTFSATAVEGTDKNLYEGLQITSFQIQ